MLRSNHISRIGIPVQTVRHQRNSHAGFNTFNQRFTAVLPLQYISARCASANNFITCDNLILIIVTEIRDACVVIVYGKFQPDLFIDANFRIEVLITDQVTAARRNIFWTTVAFRIE